MLKIGQPISVRHAVSSAVSRPPDQVALADRTVDAKRAVRDVGRQRRRRSGRCPRGLRRAQSSPARPPAASRGIARPTGLIVVGDGTKMQISPRSSEKNSLAITAPGGPAAATPCAARVAGSSPSAPWNHGPRSLEAHGLGDGGGLQGRFAAVPHGGVRPRAPRAGRAARPPPPGSCTEVRVRAGPDARRSAHCGCRRRGRCSTAPICSSGMSRSRKRRMTCAVGICSVL